jgi:hypothetical protein
MRNDDLQLLAHRILSGGCPSGGCPRVQADRFRSLDPMRR